LPALKRGYAPIRGDFLYVSKGFRFCDRPHENAGSPRHALYSLFLSFRPTFWALKVGHENLNKTRDFSEFRIRPFAAPSNPLARREKPEGDVLERNPSVTWGDYAHSSRR